MMDIRQFSTSREGRYDGKETRWESFGDAKYEWKERRESRRGMKYTE